MPLIYPSTCKAEAGGLGVQSQPWLYSKFDLWEPWIPFL